MRSGLASVSAFSLRSLNEGQVCFFIDLSSVARYFRIRAGIPCQYFRPRDGFHVTDSTGASVPLAKVQATNLATKEASNATTDNSGSYSIPLLQPGVYKLT